MEIEFYLFGMAVSSVNEFLFSSHYFSGNHPILPTEYIADQTLPVLLKWYYDRKTFTAALFFSEPVQLHRCAGMHLSFQKRNFTFSKCDPEYLEYGTVILFNFASGSILSTNHSLVAWSITTDLDLSFPGELMIFIENGTMADVVIDSNFMEPLLLKESFSGSKMDLLYHDSRLLILSFWIIHQVKLHSLGRSNLSTLSGMQIERMDFR